MASIPLTIFFEEENVNRTMKLPTNSCIADLVVEISKKAEFSGDDFGLFQKQTESNKNRWLEDSRTLVYYDISANSTLEFKKRHRTQKFVLPDENVRKIVVDGSSNIVDIIPIVCEKLHLQNPEIFSLKRIHRDQSEWMAPYLSLDEQGIKRGEAVLFRKRLYSPEKGMDTTDSVQLHLLYAQCVESFLNSVLPCSENDAIELASLLLQISNGDYNSNLKKYDWSKCLPKRYLKVKSIEKRVTNAYKSLKGTRDILGKYKFAQLCRGLNQYGMNYFRCSVTGKKAKESLIGISSEKISLIDFETFNPIHTHDFKELKHFHANNNLLTLTFGGSNEDKELHITTKDAAHIVYVIKQYIDCLVKNKNSLKPSISADEELFKELISQVIIQRTQSRSRSNTIGKKQSFQYQVPLLKNGKDSFLNAITIVQIMKEHLKAQLNDLVSGNIEKGPYLDSFNRNLIINSLLATLSNIEYLYEIVGSMKFVDLESIIELTLNEIAKVNTGVYNATYSGDPYSRKLHNAVYKVNDSVISLLKSLAKIYQYDDVENHQMIEKSVRRIEKLKSNIDALKQIVSSRMTSKTVESLLKNLIYLMCTKLVQIEEFSELHASKFKADSVEALSDSKDQIQKLSKLIKNQGQFILTERIIEEMCDYNQEIKRKVTIAVSNVDTQFEPFHDFLMYSSELEYLISNLSLDYEWDQSEEVIMMSVDLDSFFPKIIDDFGNSHTKSHLSSVSLMIDRLLSVSSAVKIDDPRLEAKMRQSEVKIKHLLNDMNRLLDGTIATKSFETVARNIIRQMQHTTIRMASYIGPSKNLKSLRSFTIQASASTTKINVFLSDSTSKIEDSTEIEKIKSLQRDIGVFTKRTLRTFTANKKNKRSRAEFTVQEFKKYQNLVNQLISTIQCVRNSFDVGDFFVFNEIKSQIKKSLDHMKVAAQIYENSVRISEATSSIDVLESLKSKIEARLRKYSRKDVRIGSQHKEAFASCIGHVRECTRELVKSFEFISSKCIYPVSSLSKRIEELIPILCKHAKLSLNGKAIMESALTCMNFLQQSIECSIEILQDKSFAETFKNTLQYLLMFISSIHSLGLIESLPHCGGRDIIEDIQVIVKLLPMVINQPQHYVDSDFIINDIERHLDALSILDDLHLCHNNSDLLGISNRSQHLVALILDFLYDLTSMSHSLDFDQEYRPLILQTEKLLECLKEDSPIEHEIERFFTHINSIKSILYSKYQNNEDIARELKNISKVVYNMKHLTMDTYSLNQKSRSADYYCQKIRSVVDHINASTYRSKSVLELCHSLKELAKISIIRLTEGEILTKFHFISLALHSLSTVYYFQKNEIEEKLESLKVNYDDLISLISRSTDFVIDEEIRSKMHEGRQHLQKLEASFGKALEFDTSILNEYASLSLDKAKAKMEANILIKDLHQKAKDLSFMTKQFITMCYPHYNPCMEAHECIELLAICIAEYISNMDKRNVNKHAKLGDSIRQHIDDILNKEIDIVTARGIHHILDINNIFTAISDLECALFNGDAAIISKVSSDLYMQRLKTTIGIYEDTLKTSSDIFELRDKINGMVRHFSDNLIGYSQGLDVQQSLIMAGSNFVFSLKEIYEGRAKDFETSKAAMEKSLHEVITILNLPLLNQKEELLIELQELTKFTQKYPVNTLKDISIDAATYEKLVQYSRKLLISLHRAIEDGFSKAYNHRDVIVECIDNMIEILREVTDNRNWKITSKVMSTILRSVIEVVEEQSLESNLSLQIGELLKKYKIIVLGITNTPRKPNPNGRKANVDEVVSNEGRVSEETEQTEQTPDIGELKGHVPDVLDPSRSLSDIVATFSKDIAVGVTNLVEISLELQKEIGSNFKNTNRPYLEDPSWDKGYISSGLGVAAAVTLLVKYANATLRGDIDEDLFIAASKAVRAATTQLVVVSRVKAPSGSEIMTKLDKASKYISDTTENLAKRVKQSYGTEITSLKTNQNKKLSSKTSLVQKVGQIDKKSEIARLEQELLEARQNLHGWRKSRYKEAI